MTLFQEQLPNSISVEKNSAICGNPLSFRGVNPFQKQLGADLRDAAFKENFAIKKQEIAKLIQESHLEITHGTSDLNQCFKNLFQQIFKSLREVSRNLITEIDPENLWRKKLRKQLSDKYQHCHNMDNYENIENFYEAVYEAFFYSSFALDGAPIPSEDLKTNIAKIMAAADLQACAGGAVAALKKITSDIKNPGSIGQLVIDGLVQELSIFHYSGNAAHVPSLIEYIISGEKSADEMMTSAAADFPIKDLAELMRLLTIKSGNLLVNQLTKNVISLVRSTKEDAIIQVKEEIRLGKEACQRILGDNALDEDAKEQELKRARKIILIIWQFFSESEKKKYQSPENLENFLLNSKSHEATKIIVNCLQFEEFFNNKINESKAKSPYAEIKNIDPELCREISSRLDQETLLEELQSVIAEVSQCQEFMQDEVLTAQIEVINEMNCYSIKNLEIPIWLKNKAAEVFKIKGSSDEDLITTITTKAQELADKFHIPLHLLKRPIDGNILFRESLPNLQSALDAGESLEEIEKLAEASDKEYEYSIKGILFHPRQLEIFKILFEKGISINLIEAAWLSILSGNIGFLGNDLLIKRFLPSQHTNLFDIWFDGEENTREIFTISHLDIILQSLRTVDFDKYKAGEDPEIATENAEKTMLLMLEQPYRNYHSMITYFLQSQIQINQLFLWAKNNSLEGFVGLIMNPAFLNGQTFINEQTLFEMMTRPENKVALDAFISMYNSTKDKTPIMESFLSTIHQALIAKNRQEEVFLLSLTLAKTDYNYYLQIAKDHLEGLNGAAFDERKAVDHFAKFLDRHQESNLPSLESVAATQEIIRLTTSEEKISYKPSFAIETLKKLSSTYKSKLENEPLYRDIIQQHLDWLKSQIEEISSKHAPEIEREKEREKQEAEIFHNYLAGTVFKDAKQDSVEDLVAATLLIISKEDFYKNGYDTPEDNFRKFKDLLMSKIPDLEKVLNPEEDAQSVFGSQDFNEYEEMQSGDEEEDVLQPETPRSTVSYPEEEPATKKQRKL